ncbi:hypothetical protein ABH922_003014 [Rhodococcus sp. 27YEA15]
MLIGRDFTMGDRHVCGESCSVGSEGCIAEMQSGESRFLGEGFVPLTGYTWSGMPSDFGSGFMGAVGAMVIPGPPREIVRMTRLESARYRVRCVLREVRYRFTMATAALKGEL